MKIAVIVSGACLVGQGHAESPMGVSNGDDALVFDGGNL